MVGYNPGMRTAPAAILLGVLAVGGLAGCGADDDAAAPDLSTASTAVPAPSVPAPIPPVTGTNEFCELALFYRQQLDKLRDRFDETHPEVALARRLAEQAEADCFSPAASAGPHSGKWVEQGGVLTCDGFMTRRDDQDYCSAEAPDDWVPFEYEGEIFYLQPLRGDTEPGSAGRPPVPSENN